MKRGQRRREARGTSLCRLSTCRTRLLRSRIFRTGRSIGELWMRQLTISCSMLTRSAPCLSLPHTVSSAACPVLHSATAGACSRARHTCAILVTVAHVTRVLTCLSLCRRLSCICAAGCPPPHSMRSRRRSHEASSVCCLQVCDGQATRAADKRLPAAERQQAQQHVAAVLSDRIVVTTHTAPDEPDKKVRRTYLCYGMHPSMSVSSEWPEADLGCALPAK